MDRYLNQLKDLVLGELKDDRLSVFIFGSRARGDHRPGSDVDVGFLAEGKLPAGKISFLKEKIENSNIPYKVDIVNFDEVSDDFRAKALEKTIIWKNMN